MLGDKDRRERGGDGENEDGLEDEGFAHGVQSVDYHSPVSSVDSVETDSFACVPLFSSRDFNLSL